MNLLFACLILFFFSIPIIAFSIHMKRSGYSAKPTAARSSNSHLQPTLLESFFAHFSNVDSSGSVYGRKSSFDDDKSYFREYLNGVPCSLSLDPRNLCRDEFFGSSSTGEDIFDSNGRENYIFKTDI